MTPTANVTLPGIGTITLMGFPLPGSQDLFPFLPPPDLRHLVVTTSWDQHGNVVSPPSRHSVNTITIIDDDLTGIDTIVHRTGGATLTGIGSSAMVPIEIVYLSLKSVAPLTVPGIPFPVDAYVGLNAGGQIAGRMNLVSTVADGSRGTADIGLAGATTDNPADPAFLGLPVFYDVLFIPAGALAIPANVVARQDRLLSVFHGADTSPSGAFAVVVPEPSTLILAGLGAMILAGRRGRRSSRRA